MHSTFRCSECIERVKDEVFRNTASSWQRDTNNAHVLFSPSSTYSCSLSTYLPLSFIFLAHLLSTISLLLHVCHKLVDTSDADRTICCWGVFVTRQFRPQISSASHSPPARQSTPLPYLSPAQTCVCVRESVCTAWRAARQDQSLFCHPPRS